jgi:undecaprenyl-phosphate galactose phosphotransferase/putative colanic acid biosynthesis UDP-glucose lipid carrier transferase
LSVRYSKYLPTIALAGDFVILNLIFVYGFCLISGKANCISEKLLIFYAYLNVSWLILSIIFKSIDISHTLLKKKMLFAYIKKIVFFFFIFLLYFQVIPLNYIPRQYIEYIFPIFFMSLIVWKFGLYYIFLIYRKMGYNYRKVIIVGINKNTQQLRDYFTGSNLNGYRFLGFIDQQKSKRRGIIGTWDDLQTIVEEQDIDEIYIGWGSIPKNILPKITEAANQFPLKIRIVPDFGEFSYKNAEPVNYGMVQVLQFHPGPLSYWYNRLIKRGFDIIFSIIIILGFLSWMSAILYLLSLLGSREGLFFLQKRTGADGKVFQCIKFRTMRKNEDADKKQATYRDKRITPVGRFLRKSSLDELPQFINVLIGQMSVVGPRPHMLRHTSQYRKLVRRFMVRHTIKPGITGLAQVRGFRGEIRKVSDIRQRIYHDVDYIEKWSFGLDLKIIMLTLLNLVKGDKKAY